MLDEFAISDESLPPIRPDQFANHGLVTAALGVFVPFVWAAFALTAIVLGLYARHIIADDVDSPRGYLRALTAVAVGTAVLAGRTMSLVLPDMA